MSKGNGVLRTHKETSDVTEGSGTKLGWLDIGTAPEHRLVTIFIVDVTHDDGGLQWIAMQDDDGAWIDASGALICRAGDPSHWKPLDPSPKGTPGEDVTADTNSALSTASLPPISSRDSRIETLTLALEQIAGGTTDEDFPFRAIGPTQMKEIARKALKSLSNPLTSADTGGEHTS